MRILVIFFLIFISFQETSAQYYTYDVGVTVGFSSFQSDYSQKPEILKQFKNTATSVSLVHYAHFFNRVKRWSPNNSILDRIMLKTGLTYNKATLTNSDSFADAPSTTGLQFRSMKGTVTTIDLGFGVEYYLKSLKEFIYPYSDMSFNPFISFGFKYSYYSNTLTSSLGDWEQDISVLPGKYREPGALSVGTGFAPSVYGGFGARFKLTEKLDLSVEGTTHYFFSDDIDGLNIPAEANRLNEFMMSAKIGIIYHLNFNSPVW